MFQGGVEESSASRKPAVKRLQSLVPLCVRQIHALRGDSDFSFFNLKIQMIYMVCIVKEIEVTSTKINYKIEDHTGSCPAMWWLEATETGEPSPNVPEAKEGAYVQLFGTIKVQDGEKSVMVLKMFLIEDANIITSHLLGVITTRIHAQKRKKVVKVKRPAGTDLINSLTFFNEGGGNAIPNFTPLQQKVFKLIQADHTTNGLSTSHILSSCPTHQKKDAQEALEFLINEGHVYSTIDSDHFKATDSS